MTATTKISIIVNGNETLVAENGPDTGFLWITSSKVNREDYVVGLLALEEASHKSTMQSIKADGDRIIKSKKAFTK